MSEALPVFSMVIDAIPDHAWKAEILVRSLIASGEVAPSRIVVQSTDRVPEAVRQRFAAIGCAVGTVAPYLDGRYCNKLRQLDRFVERAEGGSGGIVLMDVDMAVAAPLRVPFPDVICGKIVDAPNPPLSVLERIFAAAGVPLPDVVPCDWGNGETVATNFNGGFYYVPDRAVPALRAKWCAWAEFLFARPELFDNPGQCCHIDQISFALALADLGLAYRHLPANWNFPLHSAALPRSFRPDEPVLVLHYHQCLDTFGLLAPVFEGEPSVAAAVAGVNDAIATHEDLTFFTDYKRHLAREAVKAVPTLSVSPFSADFTARAASGGRRRRLILHAGTPKTGTSSLQWLLGNNRRLLADNGFWYPEPSETKMPKHQQLVGLLRHGEPTTFAGYIESALSGMPDTAHTIFFTTEGIFNHWWDYPPRAKALLRHLASHFDFELWVWFRDPVGFATAFFLQNLKNPQQDDVTRDAYGRDIDFREALDGPWFLRHLDYLGFLYEAQELFGHERVKAFPYEGDTVAAALRHLEIDFLPCEAHEKNVSMRALGVEIVRIVNRYNLPARDKVRVEKLVYEIDQIVGDRSERFRLSAEDSARVRCYTSKSWRVLFGEVQEALPPSALLLATRDGKSAAK